tara:strand:- start:4872 stop:5657 length:786 start_codon:yes stop_codon:yes gene_type:complete
MANRKTTQEFNDEFILIYGDRYDLSRVEYKNNRSHIEIVCPEHGSFSIRPFQALGSDRLKRKSGNECCPKCSKRKSHKQFMSEVKKSFTDKYDIVGKYVKNDVGIQVVHKECGSISTPHAYTILHDNPCCKLCGLYSVQLKYLEENKFKYNSQKSILYVIKMSSEETGEEFIKIGRTKRSLLGRDGRYGRPSLKGYYDIESIIEYETSTYLAALIEFDIVKDISLNDIGYIPQNTFLGSQHECLTLDGANKIDLYGKFNLR